MTGFWLSANTISAIMPGQLGSSVGLSSTNVTVTLIVANLVLALGYVGAGVISQRIGRRLFLIAMGVIMAIGGTFVYGLLVGTAPGNLFAVIGLATVIAILCGSNWGLATTYINERFHTNVRASGFGIGYSLAVILPSFYAFYQAGLGAFMPVEYTPLVFLVISGLLIIIGAAWGPETKDIDFSKEPEVQTKARFNDS